MEKRDSRIWYAAVAILTFGFADNLHFVVRLLDLRKIFQSLVITGCINIIQIILCFLSIAVAHHFGFKKSAEKLGLLSPFKRAMVFALIASLPMLVDFALTSKINSKISILTIGVGCFLAPLAEEVLFRGFMFRQLYQYARLGFWLSALIPSVLFALGHLYQSNDFGELVGIFLITGLGSLLACWIFLRWLNNLWMVLGLHSLMNLWWEIFAIDDTALGGWIANIARLLTIALAITLTIFKDRIWKTSPTILSSKEEDEKDK